MGGEAKAIPNVCQFSTSLGRPSALRKGHDPESHRSGPAAPKFGRICRADCLFSITWPIGRATHPAALGRVLVPSQAQVQVCADADANHKPV
jgi:hypothetical protein